jgi:hypothetical protein
LEIISLQEHKTGKSKHMPINESLKGALRDYLAEYPGRKSASPLFFSQQTFRNRVFSV